MRTQRHKRLDVSLDPEVSSLFNRTVVPSPQAQAQHSADKTLCRPPRTRSQTERYLCSCWSCSSGNRPERPWHMCLKTLSSFFTSEHEPKGSASSLKSRLWSRMCRRVCLLLQYNWLSKQTYKKWEKKPERTLMDWKCSKSGKNFQVQTMKNIYNKYSELFWSFL